MKKEVNKMASFGASFIKQIFPIFSAKEKAEEYLSAKLKQEINVDQIKVSFSVDSQIVGFRYKLGKVIEVYGKPSERLHLKTGFKDSLFLEAEYLILDYLYRKVWVDNKIIVPQPLFYDRKLGCFVRNAIAGENLASIILRKNSLTKTKSDDSLHLLLAALREVNWQKMPIKPPYFLKNRLNEMATELVPLIKLAKWKILDLKNLEFDLAEFIGLATDILERLGNLKLRESEMSFCHGDLHHQNILCQMGKVGLIDFDKAGIFSSLYDLGSYLFYLDYKFNRVFDRKTLMDHKQKMISFFLTEKPSEKKRIGEINLFQAEIALRIALSLMVEVVMSNDSQRPEITQRTETLHLLAEKIGRCLKNQEPDLEVYRYFDPGFAAE